MKPAMKLLILLISILISWGGWKALNALFFQETISFFNPKSEVDLRRVNRTREEWKKILTPEQFRVMFEKGTEPAFSGRYNDF